MACQIGRNMAKNELFMLNQPDMPFTEVCKIFNLDTPEELFKALGRTELSTSEFSDQILARLWANDTQTETEINEYKNGFLTSQAIFSADNDMFIIEHSGNRELELCSICNPRPGDPIIGSILRKNLVRIHTDGCSLLTPDTMRGGNALRLRWGSETTKETQAVTLRVYAHDRDGLLNDITNLFKQDEINLNFLWSQTEHFKALIVFSANYYDPEQVVQFLHKAHDLKNVIHAGYMGPTRSNHFNPANFFNENPDSTVEELEKIFLAGPHYS